MVFLDVVYNHFGPEGNYLPLYVPQFFTERYHTPWGAAIDFKGERVREFFVHNALYWLEEYNIDGLRLDAVHAIRDESEKHFLVELAERVRSGPGRERHVHLVLENEAKEVSYLRGPYNAQWNDDIHHALHVTLTGESAGYYADYADSPVQLLGRCLAEGFAYPAEPDANLSPSAFVSFVQNHDQIGNRAFGERIVQLARPEALRAAAEISLLAPQIPMLFMGEERGASTPFPFFCDFEPELAQLVARGRREEFAAFPEFSDPASRERIPDPGAEETFRAAVLDWGCLRDPECGAWLDLYGELLSLRHDLLVPRLGGISGGRAAYRLVGDRGLSVRWTLQDGALLTLLANLGPEPLGGFETPPGELLYTSDGVVEPGRVLPGWSVSWHYAGAG